MDIRSRVSFKLWLATRLPDLKLWMWELILILTRKVKETTLKEVAEIGDERKEGAFEEDDEYNYKVEVHNSSDDEGKDDENKKEEKIVRGSEHCKKTDGKAALARQRSPLRLPSPKRGLVRLA
ncbi:hypothetical protein NL676_009417 [Syzygium grande]|nr:hypothetical protein NL676_009417 [Syzygium grande]